MKTARSTYHAWVAGREARAARRRADEALAHEITVIHLASRRNYGVPRVTAELRRRADRLTASGWNGSCGSTASPGTAGAPDTAA
ncbi:transposase [Streptomyces sp. NPDC051658]|uniref:transposase n=1 Tax=Streptomyces sp. NPDC051658 TaxID=3365667 RepID=UPI00379D47DD